MPSWLQIELVAYVTASSQSMHDSIYVTLHLLQLNIWWALFGGVVCSHNVSHNSLAAHARGP